MKAVFDTNVLIDYLNGINAARKELARYERGVISLVSWMEVMAGAQDDDEPAVRAFLQSFELAPIDMPVAAKAVQIRQSHRMKLPDAIILATAESMNLMLVTRNTKDFPPERFPNIRMPYTVERQK